MSKEQKYGIIGAGRFGASVARELIALGREVVALDIDEGALAGLSDIAGDVYVMPKLDRESLEEAGIGECDVAIIGIGRDIESSLLAALHCIKLNVPRVIAKANSEEHAQILRMIGAEVVFPEVDMGERLARRLSSDILVDYMSFGDGFAIVKAAVPNSLLGVSVKDSGLRNRWRVNIVALDRGGQVEASVSPDLVFGEGDTLILAGAEKDLTTFLAKAR